MSGSPLKRFSIWSSVEISEATEATELDSQNVPTVSTPKNEREKPPYHYLSQQSRQMWSKWHNAEKEVIVRESVTNRNVMLGQAFFMKALGYSQQRCSAYFDTVITKWVTDQLQSGDIEKAEDILAKAGHNPIEKLKEICLNSCDAVARDYLVDYLSTKNLLGEEEVDAWRFLRKLEGALNSADIKKMVRTEKNPQDQKLRCFHLPISLVVNCGQEWQNLVWADIFLNTPVDNYEDFVLPELAWKVLINHNDVQTVMKWISHSAGASKSQLVASPSGQNMPFQKSALFSGTTGDRSIKYALNQEMVDMVLIEDGVTEIKEMVLDFLCMNGWHSSSDLGWRIFNHCSRTGLIPKIAESWLSKNNDEYTSFMLKQFAGICVDNALPEVLSICLPHDGHSLQDVCNYFKGPIISENDRYSWGVPVPFDSSQFDEISLKYPPFSSPSICSVQTLECQILVRDLLHGHPPDSHGLLGGHNLPGGQSDMEELRHFSQAQLSTSFNSDVKADFLYYLRQARPTYAAISFLVDQIASHGSLHNDSLSRACHLAQGLALSAAPLSMVGTACATFVTMIGGASETIRLFLAATKACSSYGASGKSLLDVSSLIESPDACFDELLRVLELQVINTPAPPKEIIGMLFMYGLNVSLSKFCGKDLPEALPKYFAENDLWLEFVLCLQIYRYPLEQVVRLVRSFKSPQLRCHLWHALQMVEPVASYRKDVYYSRIGIKRHQSSEMLPQKESSPFALGDTAAKIMTPNTQLASSEIWDSKNSLYTSLLRYHSRVDTFQPLPVVVENPPNPALCVMETCLEGNSNVESLCKWLIATCWNFGLHESWAIRKKEMETENSLHMTAQSSSYLNHSSVDNNDGKTVVMWSHCDTVLLLEEVVRRGYFSLLSKGFFIFLPDNPLHLFTKFLSAAVEENDYQKALKYILHFKNQLSAVQENESKGNVESVNFFKDIVWDTKTMLHMAHSMILNTLAIQVTSSQQRLNILGIYRQAELFKINPESIPDFDMLYGLQECLCKEGPKDLGFELDFLGLPPLVSNYPSEKWLLNVKNCLNGLIEMGSYDIGLQFAEIAKLPKDSVLIDQWKKNFKKYSLDSSKCQDQLQLGLNVRFGPSPIEACNTSFVMHGISPDVAAKFFYQVANEISSVEERYKMLKMALHWIGKANKAKTSFLIGDQSEELDADEVELNMWKCRLELEMDEKSSVEVSEGSSLLPLRLSTEKIHRRAVMKEQVAVISETPTALGSLIGVHLEAGDLATAIRLETLFSHADRDVSLLLTCMALAEGDMYPEDAEHIALAAEEGASTLMPFQPSRLCRPGSLQSLSPVSIKSHLMKMSTLPGECSTMNKEQTELCCKVLAMLERLVNQIQRGRSLGVRIVTCFRLAFYLNMPFLDILNLANPVESLRHHLWDVDDGDWVKCNLEKSSQEDEAQRKLSLASDILLAAQFDQVGKAEFLRHEIVAAIKEFEEPGSRGAGCSSGKVLMWGLSLDDHFPAILDLCEDDTTCSLLGDSLLIVANDLLSADPPHRRKVVELLIRSHDCHTRACNMEGISRILHHARILTSSLLLEEEWSLMVRLLTGIRRYTEMNYILQILREHEQFEYVLSKGMDKVPGLRVALLDFLRRHCPGDKELLRLVVLHFRLHSEAAELWLSEANAIIAGIPRYTVSSDISPKMNLLAERCIEEKLPLFECSSKIKADLKLAIQSFSHAAEYYLQANQPNAASKCAHQAELTALQVSIVDVPDSEIAPCLLCLESLQVALIVKTVLSFPQAWILVRAYQVVGNWAAAIFTRYVQNGDSSYLADFLRCKTLTSTIMEDIARRYLLEGSNVSQEMNERMANLLSAVPNIEICYRLSSCLGLWGLTGSLLTSPHLPYLRDVVWGGKQNSQN